MGKVKGGPAAGRTQRKAIARLPAAMLERTRELFPNTFEEHTVEALFALRALAQRINDRSNDVLAPLGLNAAKYNHLVVIYMSPKQQLTMNEISNLIHTTNSSVTSMIDVLERDGLVKRVPNPDDGRSVVVHLTAKGRRRVAEAIPLRNRDIAIGMGALSVAERAQFVSLLIRISESFDREADDA